MNRDQIIETIRALSHSQGFYGRLLNSLESMDLDNYDHVMTILEDQHFSDPVYD